MASGAESVAPVPLSHADGSSVMSIDEVEDGPGSTPISSPHNASVRLKKTNGDKDKDKSKSKGKDKANGSSKRKVPVDDDEETNGRRLAKLEIVSTRPATSVTGSHVHHLESEPDGGPSHQTITSGPDEEAMLYPQPRMLQDSTGRLLYLGDSATLSYLQLIRMIVESVAGPSSFTLDPRRHRIMENTISLPPYIRAPHILPDRQCADILVESYFTNTNGLIEVVNRKSFIMAMDSCYSDPLAVDSPFLCILHLVFAIGLVLATPLPGTREDAVIRRLRDGQFDRAELFFRSAKCLGDPESGFEDADFWSVQALLLMSVYTLAVSKRNAAYAYYGTWTLPDVFFCGRAEISNTRDTR